MIDPDAEALLLELLRIDSVNPSLVPGGAGEAAIASFAGDWLRQRGFEVERIEAQPGRPSIVARSCGRGSAPSIMLNGHLDTVTLQGYDGDGLAPTIDEHRIAGRGAYDMKSGLAAIMVAGARALEHGHAGDIVLALVADEEHGSLGTEEVLQHVRTDAAIVVEPSGLDVVTAHRGFVWAEVTVHGVAAHGSRRDLGVDAIAAAGGLLTGIADLDRSLAQEPPHPVLGTANVHASTIVGGEEASSYPAQCTTVIEWRTLPGQTAATVTAALDHILQPARALPGVRAAVQITTSRDPFEAASDSRIVAEVTAAAAPVLGAPPCHRGEPFWTDCALLAEAGIDTVLFGVDGGGAHAATEWVTRSSLAQVTNTLFGVMTAAV